MKKLIFLLLILLVGVSVAFAAVLPSGPPGAITLEASLPGYGVDYYSVTPSTVLTGVLLGVVQPANEAAVQAYNDSAVRPQYNKPDYYSLL